MGKSQIKSQVQITNHLQKLFKSKPQIKNQITNTNQIQIIFGPNQITHQFYRNVKFLKMFSLHNNYRISQKSQPFCIR